MKMSIQVQKGLCPITLRVSYALYIGDLPLVAPTIYLKHIQVNVGCETNTLAAIAYGLKPFFEFLELEGISFWEIRLSTIKQYKRFFLYARDENGLLKLKRESAQQYLISLKGAIHYWRGFGDEDHIFFDKTSELDGVKHKSPMRKRFSSSSWYVRVPASLWRIRVPPKEKHNKSRYKGLSRERCSAVMRFLNHRKHITDVQTMLYYRNRAIWTFLLMTGLRKGELCRVRVEDVNQVTGIITLKERQEDVRLGELKTGPGEIFVSPNNPLWNYLNSWLLEGRWIAEERLISRGDAVHQMLFCNRNCGPLTQAAVDNLFLLIKKGCGFRSDVLFHPHITRHTTASLMLNSEVDIEQVQKFLRHRSITSTEVYTQVADPAYRGAMKKFWENCEGLSSNG